MSKKEFRYIMETQRGHSLGKLKRDTTSMIHWTVYTAYCHQCNKRFDFIPFADSPYHPGRYIPNEISCTKDRGLV